MTARRYQVVYTGRCAAGMDRSTVISNLVLDLGVSEEKARILLNKQRVVLKRFTVAGDAQKMVAKLEHAGLMCAIVEEAAIPVLAAGSSGGGESTLVSFLSRFAPLKKK